MIGAVLQLGQTLIGGVTGYFQRKQQIKQSVADNKARLASDKQSHNQSWEMAQLENAGWKDDVLFYAILGMYAYSAIDPIGAQQVFASWQNLPEWFLEITGWLVASVIGVKKIGDYLPATIMGIKTAIKYNPNEKGD